MFSRYNRKDSIQSTYCYSDTEIYVNNFSIVDYNKLNAIEADLTSIRLIELSNGVINGRFGVNHLLRIHKYIFQDLYPFAGKIRVEDIWKGNTFFCKVEFIEDNLQRILHELKNEKYLKIYDKCLFISRLAFYMSELNVIHPFREGNGRAIREFIRQLALKNKYELNWSEVESDTLLEAMISAVDHDFKPLEDCLRQALASE